MPEKEKQFAYSVQEVVEWATENMRNGLFRRLDEEVVNRHVDEMQSRGWNEKKIFKKCSVIYAADRYPQIALHHLVQADHPVLQEWSEDKIRSGLYSAAIHEIANDKATLFEWSLPGRNVDDFHKRLVRDGIRETEEYASRLSLVYTPPQEIRNR